jgi:uncharacterized membrane protein
VYIGIYWNNHHHLLRSTTQISGAVMWANLHLLFWLSLIPVMTDWIGNDYRAHLAASTYGVVALVAGAAYTILVRAIIAVNGPDSAVARAIGSDVKGYLSILFYAFGVGASWITPWLGYAAYAAVAVMWFVPDRRMHGQSPA